MPELTAVLSASREKIYGDRKFAASLKGIDLDEQSSGDEWEKLKARVASRGKAADANDILSLQGQAAVSAGFGINNGLDYEDLTQPAEKGGEELIG